MKAKMLFSGISSLLYVISVHAGNLETFKKDPLSTLPWYPYVLILGILFAVLFILAKKSKNLIKPHPTCQIIERIPIHHKTQVYVIDLYGQRFLIADNQNALAIHPVQKEEISNE